MLLQQCLKICAQLISFYQQYHIIEALLADAKIIPDLSTRAEMSCIGFQVVYWELSATDPRDIHSLR